MTDTMQTLVVLEPDVLEIQEKPVPVPGPHEVLARVRSTAICGTDAHLIHGDYPGFWPPAFPFTPGHEWAGEIVALGPGAEAFGWQVGDRVAGTSHNACGACQKCVEGQYNLCENYGKPGLHAQYGHNAAGRRRHVRRPRREVHLPAARRGVLRRGRGRRPGQHRAARGAPRQHQGRRHRRRHGRRRDRPAGRRRGLHLRRRPGRSWSAAATAWRRPRAMGFETVDTNAGDPVAAVRELTGGLGADVVLECAGVPDTLTWAMAMLRRGGRCAMVGIPTEDVALAIQPLVLDELELVGSRASAGEMRRVMPFVANGRMRVGELITHSFPLSEYEKALAVFNDRSSGAIKIIIHP